MNRNVINASVMTERVLTSVNNVVNAVKMYANANWEGSIQRDFQRQFKEQSDLQP